MNQIHAKWVQFLQNLNKQASVTSNKVSYAFSRINLILHEFKVNVFGFDELKEMYKDDAYFRDACAACEKIVNMNIT